MVLSSCGRIGFDPIGAGSNGDTCSGPFDAPQPLIELNSAGTDAAPWLSEDRLEIWFESDRRGFANLYRAVRASADLAFDPPVEVPGFDHTTTYAEHAPALSDDGLTLWFSAGPIINTSVGPHDLYTATRATTGAVFGSWDALMALNDPSFFDDSPSLTADGNTIVFSSDRRGTTDLYLATRTDAGFGAPTRIEELTTNAVECCPAISTTGDSLLFARTNVIVQSDRGATSFGPAVPILPTSTGADLDPYQTHDRRTLVFASNRTGGMGGFDLYIATRSSCP